MKNFSCAFFSSWPYDQALAYMDEAWHAVKKNPDAFFVGCGSHREVVVTTGRDHAKQGNCALPSHVLFRHLDRGGGMTAHEPGQLVLYPIFHADRFGLTIPAIVDILECTMIDFLSELDLIASRHALGPGIFVGDAKIGFIGLRIKERIVQHGLALNLMNDAQIFHSFDPCGMRNLAVTSACHHVTLSKDMSHYQSRLTYFFLRNLLDRTTMGINFDVGVLLSSATDSSGTSTLPSGK